MAADRSVTNVDVTTGSILRLVGLLVALLALWQVRGVVAVVLFSIVFASAIRPGVDWMQRHRIPRGLGITLIYLLILATLALAVYLFGQLVTDQVKELTNNLPSIYERTVERLFGNTAVDQQLTEAIRNWLQSLSNGLVDFTSQILAGTVSLFGSMFSLIAVLVLTFYLALEQDGFRKFMAAVAPVGFLPYLYQLIDRIQDRLGGWVRGQLLLTLIIGGASFVGLVLIGIPYAFSLAMVAGITELVPIAGPIIGAIPAILVAFGVSPVHALLAALLYLVIQQLENNLVVPKVMQKTTGLNPIVTIVVVLIGGTLAGFAGIVLAIPVTLIIDSFFEDFFKEEGETGASDAPVTSDV